MAEDPIAADWPKHFPEGCPPQEARETTGRVFRLMDDFKSAIERDTHKFAPPCQRAGLSSFLTQEEAIILRKAVGNLRRLSVGAGDLDKTHGRIMQTPTKQLSGHHTLWLKEAHLANFKNIFRAIE